MDNNIQFNSSTAPAQHILNYWLPVIGKLLIFGITPPETTGPSEEAGLWAKLVRKTTLLWLLAVAAVGPLGIWALYCWQLGIPQGTVPLIEIWQARTTIIAPLLQPGVTSAEIFWGSVGGILMLGKYLIPAAVMLLGFVCAIWTSGALAVSVFETEGGRLLILRNGQIILPARLRWQFHRLAWRQGQGGRALLVEGSSTLGKASLAIARPKDMAELQVLATHLQGEMEAAPAPLEQSASLHRLQITDDTIVLLADASSRSDALLPIFALPIIGYVSLSPVLFWWSLPAYLFLVMPLFRILQPHCLTRLTVRPDGSVMIYRFARWLPLVRVTIPMNGEHDDDTQTDQHCAKTHQLKQDIRSALKQIGKGTPPQVDEHEMEKIIDWIARRRHALTLTNSSNAP